MTGDITITVKPSYSTTRQYEYLGVLNEIPTQLGHVGSVQLAQPDPVAVGVTLWEVVSVYLVGQVAQPFLEQLVQQLATAFASWVIDRCKRGKGPPSNVSVKIYGPHGEVLRTVVIDKTGELQQDK